MADSFWHGLGRQLQSPSGMAGYLTGLLMRLVNASPNRLAVDALRVAPGDKILELGCGPGHAIKLISEQSAFGVVYGIDQSPVMLKQAEKRNRLAVGCGRVLLRRASFEALPFADASIDKILAVNVIYFWRDPFVILKEIRRVLRPDGRMVIYATDAATMRQWKFAGQDTHITYSIDDLRNILEDGGFSMAHIGTEKISLFGGIGGILMTVSKQSAPPAMAQSNPAATDIALNTQSSRGTRGGSKA